MASNKSVNVTYASSVAPGRDVNGHNFNLQDMLAMGKIVHLYDMLEQSLADGFANVGPTGYSLDSIFGITLCLKTPTGKINVTLSQSGADWKPTANNGRTEQPIRGTNGKRNIRGKATVQQSKTKY